VIGKNNNHGPTPMATPETVKRYQEKHSIPRCKRKYLNAINEESDFI